jgi:hypothetical protein
VQVDLPDTPRGGAPDGISKKEYEDLTKKLKTVERHVPLHSITLAFSLSLTLSLALSRPLVTLYWNPVLVYLLIKIPIAWSR